MEGVYKKKTEELNGRGLKMRPQTRGVLLRLIMKMTRFPNGLVMGLADCINYAGLVKTLEKSSKRKLGPFPDTLQAGACVFPPFQNVSVSNNYGFVAFIVLSRRRRETV